VFVQLLLWMAPLLFLNRRDQCLRIIALQQQLEVYQRQQGGRRLQLTDQDRRFWVMLRARWSGWRSALVIVKPETVVAWHRRLGGWWQRRQCRPPGRSPLPEQVQALIRRMASENPVVSENSSGFQNAPGPVLSHSRHSLIALWREAAQDGKGV